MPCSVRSGRQHPTPASATFMQLQTVYFGTSGLAHPPSWGVIDRRRPVGRAGLDLGRRRQRRYRHSPLPSRGKGPAKQHSSINRADARTDGGAHLRFRVIPIGGNRVDLCWFGQSAERLDRYTSTRGISTGQRERAIRNEAIGGQKLILRVHKWPMHQWTAAVAVTISHQMVCAFWSNSPPGFRGVSLGIKLVCLPLLLVSFAGFALLSGVAVHFHACTARQNDLTSSRNTAGKECVSSRGVLRSCKRTSVLRAAVDRTHFFLKKLHANERDASEHSAARAARTSLRGTRGKQARARKQSHPAYAVTQRQAKHRSAICVCTGKN